jgi:hypothetical protein
MLTGHARSNINRRLRSDALSPSESAFINTTSNRNQSYIRGCREHSTKVIELNCHEREYPEEQQSDH